MYFEDLDSGKKIRIRPLLGRCSPGLTSPAASSRTGPKCLERQVREAVLLANMDPDTIINTHGVCGSGHTEVEVEDDPYKPSG